MAIFKRLRRDVLWQAGQGYAQQQPHLRFSVVSDFVKNVKSAVDSNPELKRSVEELKKHTETVTGSTKAASETIQKAAAASAQAAREATEQATHQVRSAVKGFRPRAAEQGESEESGRRADSASASSSQPEEPAGSSAGTSHSAGSTSSASQDKQEPPRSGPSSQASGRRTITGRIRNVFSTIRKEVEDAVLPREETASATRARDPSLRPAGEGRPQQTAVSVVKQEESRWQKQWAEMQDKNPELRVKAFVGLQLGLHPIFRRLRGFGDNKVFNKGREVAEDLRERWDTSDSPLVHRIQDMRDSMFTETEQAQALREIRARYPAFDMVQFMRLLKADVPLVIKAYLEGDLDVLRQHCAPEMMERFNGIIAAQKAQGLGSDSTILDTSDVELVDLKFLDGEPVIVVQFTCQQINCTRDTFGNVVEGGPQDVQRVYYYWALQQDDAGFVGNDGKWHPPRWQLREMMMRGMHNLL